MLDDVGSDIFLEQPARENLPPTLGIVCAARAFADDDLHKGPLIGVGFPWCGAFASTDADNNLASADGFSRFQFEIAGVAVAFVQQPDHGHAFSHGRSRRIGVDRGKRNVGGRGFAFCGFLAGLFAPHIASRQRQCAAQSQQDQLLVHQPSGLHA
jgi:hypothetical protein